MAIPGVPAPMSMPMPGLDALGNPLAPCVDATMLLMQQMQYGAQASAAGLLGYQPAHAFAPGALGPGALMPGGLAPSSALPLLPGMAPLASGTVAAASLPELARKDLEQLCLRFGITGAIKEDLFVEMSKRTDTFDTDLRLLERSLSGARTPAGMLSVKLKEMKAGKYGQVGECGDFRKGLCTRGEACRYSHNRPGVPASVSVAAPVVSALTPATSAMPSVIHGGFPPSTGILSDFQKRQLDQFSVRFKLDTSMQQELALELQRRVATFDQDLNILHRILEKAVVPAGLLSVKLRELREGRFGSCAPTEMCGDFRKGLCSRGEACRYSHGQGIPALQMQQLLQSAPVQQPLQLAGALAVADPSLIRDDGQQRGLSEQPEPLSRLGPPGGGWDTRKRGSPKRDAPSSNHRRRSRSQRHGSRNRSHSPERKDRSRSRSRDHQASPAAVLVESEVGAPRAVLEAAAPGDAVASEAATRLSSSYPEDSNKSIEPSSTFEALLGPDAVALPPPAARPVPDVIIESGLLREAKRGKEREERIEEKEDSSERAEPRELEKRKRPQLQEGRPLVGAMKELDNMLKAESDNAARVASRSLGPPASREARDAAQSTSRSALNGQDGRVRRIRSLSRGRERRETRERDSRKEHDDSRSRREHSHSRGRKDDHQRRDHDRSRSRDRRDERSKAGGGRRPSHGRKDDRTTRDRRDRDRSKSRDRRGDRGRSRKRSQSRVRSRDRKDKGGGSRKQSRSHSCSRTRGRNRSRSRKRSRTRSRNRKEQKDHSHSRDRDRDRKDKANEKKRESDRKEDRDRKDDRDRKEDRNRKEREGHDRRDNKDTGRSRNCQEDVKARSKSSGKKHKKDRKTSSRSQSERDEASNKKGDEKKDKKAKVKREKDTKVKEKHNKSEKGKDDQKKTRKASSSSSSPKRVKKKGKRDEPSAEGKKKTKASDDESRDPSKKKSKAADSSKDKKNNKSKKCRTSSSDSNKMATKKAKRKKTKAKHKDSSSDDTAEKTEDKTMESSSEEPEETTKVKKKRKASSEEAEQNTKAEKDESSSEETRAKAENLSSSESSS